MNKDYCVYMHTSPSGKRYIGITSQKPERRWRKTCGGYHWAYLKDLDENSKILLGVSSNVQHVYAVNEQVVV